MKNTTLSIILHGLFGVRQMKDARKNEGVSERSTTGLRGLRERLGNLVAGVEQVGKC